MDTTKQDKGKVLSFYQLKRQAEADVDKYFIAIKNHTEYCASCGKPYNMKSSTHHHLPFCEDCRASIIAKVFHSVENKNLKYVTSQNYNTFLKQKFLEEWKHFCGQINFKDSFLDARAVAFMNNFDKYLNTIYRMKDSIFIKHIKEHLKPHEKVICKICGKSVEDIIKEGYMQEEQK
jgi:endogenous inhibitor of DNA gyrase (YacG/DUF329 family)